MIFKFTIPQKQNGGCLTRQMVAPGLSTSPKYSFCDPDYRLSSELCVRVSSAIIKGLLMIYFTLGDLVRIVLFRFYSFFTDTIKKTLGPPLSSSGSGLIVFIIPLYRKMSTFLRILQQFTALRNHKKLLRMSGYKFLLQLCNTLFFWKVYSPQVKNNI